MKISTPYGSCVLRRTLQTVSISEHNNDKWIKYMDKTMTRKRIKSQHRRLDRINTWAQRKVVDNIRNKWSVTDNNASA